MQCFILLVALAMPRLALVLVYLFGQGYLTTAYGTWLWPLLGFFFLPLTTLVYAWAIHTYAAIEGLGLVAVILAVLVDLGLVGAARKRKKKD